MHCTALHFAARLSRALSFRTAPPARGWLSLAPASTTPVLLFTPFSAQSVRTIASIAPAASAPAEVAGKDAAQRCWAVAVGVAAGFAWAAHDVLTTAASDKQGTAALADKQGGRGNAVVTEDDAYMKGIKLYGIGIKDDPVPGEKRGKGMQRMNSSYWMLVQYSTHRRLSKRRPLLGVCWRTLRAYPAHPAYPACVRAGVRCSI